MEQILALYYYVPLELIQAIMMTYRGYVAIVKTKDGESGPIPQALESFKVTHSLHISSLLW